MAEIVENEAGFKAIKITRAELVSKLGQYGAVGICDFCSTSPEIGYYLPVLNQWYCPECYDNFVNNTTPHPDDSWYEERNFAKYKRIFAL